MIFHDSRCADPYSHHLLYLFISSSLHLFARTYVVPRAWLRSQNVLKSMISSSNHHRKRKDPWPSVASLGTYGMLQFMVYPRTIRCPTLSTRKCPVHQLEGKKAPARLPVIERFWRDDGSPEEGCHQKKKFQIFRSKNHRLRNPQNSSMMKALVAQVPRAGLF